MDISELGRAHCTYYVGPGEGMRLDLVFIAYPDRYSANVLLNGVRVRHAQRRRFRDALRWASTAAANFLVTFGVTPPQQLAFDQLIDQVGSSFVA